MNGLFITIEGIDGSGKSTQANLLVTYLKKHFDVVQTREPGGSPSAEMIRDLVLPLPSDFKRRKNDDVTLHSPISELLLMEAARAEHFQTVIIPALKKGNIIVCDRNIDSSIAYQGYGRGIDIATIKQLNHIAAQGVMPDVTLFFDIDPETSYKRIQSADRKGLDRMELEGLEFQKKVRQGFLACAKEEPNRIIRIPVDNETIESIHAQVVSIIEKKMQFRHGK